ncbi:MAG: hypothetical protein HOG79_16860 [Prolixibacteraceae bacterium]|nr:hypothetical protein [Prolixibacteraceae bacterium]
MHTTEPINAPVFKSHSNVLEGDNTDLTTKCRKLSLSSVCFVIVLLVLTIVTSKFTLRYFEEQLV